MNKILAAILIFSSSVVLGYHNNARNLTPYSADVQVDYVGASAISCRPDKYTVGSNQSSSSINAGACAIKSVIATVKAPSGAVQARKYNGPFSGDAVFLIVGPINGNQYKVTRYVH